VGSHAENQWLATAFALQPSSDKMKRPANCAGVPTEDQVLRCAPNGVKLAFPLRVPWQSVDVERTWGDPQDGRVPCRCIRPSMGFERALKSLTVEEPPVDC